MPTDLISNSQGNITMTDTQNKRPFVLVHGACHGGWCWKKLTPLLRAAGHEVYTPTQTGLGERSHLLQPGLGLDVFFEDIANMILWEDLHEVILVGHSFGGITITALADRMPGRISQLVYLDSLIVQDGESPFDILPPEVARARQEESLATSGGLTMAVPPPEMFGVTDPADAQWLRERCTPHPMSTYEDRLPLRHPTGNGLPTTYIAVTPYYGPTTSSREYAQSRNDWTYIEMQAGHDAMVTHPQELARLLLAIPE